MNIYLCTTQPDILRFLVNQIEKHGHNCLLFTSYINLSNTLFNSKYLPDLVILDYMVENHILSTNSYEKLYQNKIYLPLIYYNDPCIAKGARTAVWKNVVENFIDESFIPPEKVGIPTIDDMEEVFKMVSRFVESDEFSQYIYLMQKPKPFPESYKTDYLYEKLIYTKNHYKTIYDFKQAVKLPENLFALLQVLYDNLEKDVSITSLKNLYQEKKANISENSLKVLISKLKAYFKAFPDFNYILEHNKNGYKFFIAP